MSPQNSFYAVLLLALTAGCDKVYAIESSGMLDARYQAGDNGLTEALSSTRQGDEEQETLLGQAGASLRWQGDGDWRARVDVLAYQHSDQDLGVSEAFLQWKPLSTSVWQSSVRAGAFFPSLSVENTDALWLSPWTLSFSAINAWVAEEVRSVGLEYSLRYAGRLNGGGQEAEFSLGAISHNDVAGAALAWRGFRISDRISRLGDELALPYLPTVADGGFFQGQDERIAPFRETDDRAGFYVNAQWDIGATQIKALHWDNRATPALLERGQYGWDTQFDHIAAHWHGEEWFVGTQWLSGHTHMGGITAPNVVFDFNSAFLLLGWRGDIHQFALRSEQFRIDDKDLTPADNNDQDGKAATLSWGAAWSTHFNTMLEYQYIDSEHALRSYSAVTPAQIEKIWQLALQWKW